MFSQNIKKKVGMQGLADIMNKGMKLKMAPKFNRHSEVEADEIEVKPQNVDDIYITVVKPKKRDYWKQHEF